MANYSQSSPYFSTPQVKNELQVLSFRKITHETDDLTYEIAAEFDKRPDLLAYDLYGDASLWWVFTNRNPDVLKDPIWDFTPGKIIFPSPSFSFSRSRLQTWIDWRAAAIGWTGNKERANKRKISAV